MRAIFLPLLLVASVLGGCLGSDSPGDVDSEGRWTQDLDGLRVAWAPGALGTVSNSGGQAVELRLPNGFLWVDGATISLADEAASIKASETRTFLAPPSTVAPTFGVDGVNRTLSPDAAASARTFASGENVIELMEHQQAEFPHRTPGQENYPRSVAYFAELFAELGYDVEVDPHGTQPLTATTGLCTPNGVCPESLANVVAMKPGTDPDAGIIFVAGGHFDVVPATTHGAFDNTGGSMATIELARALAPYEFRHDLYFGLWGGEENGILGSRFWVESHPELIPRIKSYWNLDVIGMSWPAPLVKPDPLVIAAGPDVPTFADDGSVADPLSATMLRWAKELQTAWLGFPGHIDGRPLWHYEGIVSGQVAGYAGVNAQSDHTSFASAGIPAYFIFNGDALAGDNPVRIHNERDTLENMTKYAVYGGDFDIDDPTWPDIEDRAVGRAALADSFETAMWFPLYHTLLVDLGLHDPPQAAVFLGETVMPGSGALTPSR